MFRFTIRDVLWLMVVVGVAAGWASDRTWSAAKRQQVEMARLNYIIDMQSELADYKLAIEQMREEIKSLKQPATEAGTSN